MNAIETKQLTKKYKDLTAVNALDLEVREGELFALLGVNGAGKTTTIKMLSCLSRPTAGDALLLGKSVSREPEAVKRLIAVSPQETAVAPKLTVRENLALMAGIHGTDRAAMREKIDALSRRFGLDEVLKRPAGKLSGGWQRRLSIAMALILEPKILFLDEPTTGLDPKTRRLVWEHIHQLRREAGLTLFLTTHYMEETADADNVVILDKGRIVAQGSPAALKSAHAGSRLLWYAPRTEKNDRRLAGREFRYEADHYAVPFRGDVTELLWRNRDVMTDYEVVKGSMDDVFLQLTGKEFTV